MPYCREKHMKECKKRKIKGFHKKSVWPSIVLFLIFIAFCLQLAISFVKVFEVYLMDSKMADIKDSTEHLGGLIAARMEGEDLLDAVSYVRGYLKKENDISVIDRDFQVLLHFGETAPDFGNGTIIKFFDVYKLVPDAGMEIPDWENMLILPIEELWERTMQAPPRKDAASRESWLKEPIFSVGCWMEIPIKADGYHLYYKDAVTLLRRDVIYMFMVGTAAILVLLMPIILLFINVLSSIAMQKRMVKLLYLDPATGGNNWTYFIHHSKKILCPFWNARHTYIVANLHLDRFQDYCAYYGSGEGEELLRNIDGFLRAKVGEGELFARYEGADFGLLLRCGSRGYHSRECNSLECNSVECNSVECSSVELHALELCEKRMKKMLAELTGIKRDRKLSFHVGLYVIPAVNETGMFTDMVKSLQAGDAGNQRGNSLQRRRQTDIDQVYHYAAAARLTLAGQEGERIKVFDHQILEEQLWKRKVEDTMELALVNKEFQIYLQPKINPLSGKIVGAEALVRWLSPTDGLIKPSRFIPIFEENGFITKLDDYMISAVAKLQSEWKLQGRKSLPVSVNVSRANFTKENLAEHICQLVDEYGAEHSCIELELTERAFFGNKDILQKIIKELKMYGFLISMDDFGAGYSSLNSLKDLPVDVLKLDMEFFQGEDAQERGEIVVKETIQLAKNLNMKIVAEGIERRDQVEFLAQQGCDMIQGFYYAEPMPVSEFDEKVEQEAAGGVRGL